MALIGTEVQETTGQGKHEVESERVELATIPALPKQSTLALNPYARAVGRITNIAIDQTPEGEAQSDLAGDAFFNLWQSNPQEADPTPDTRAVNKALLDWAKELHSWQPMREQAKGNIPVSMVSASLLWARLTEADALQAALEKQEQAAAAEAEAERAELEAMAKTAQANELEDALEQDPNPNPQTAGKAAQAKRAAIAAQQQAAAARKQMQKLMGEAMAAVEDAQANPMAQAAVTAAVHEAAEAGGEAAEALAGWGSDMGDAVRNNPKGALDFFKHNTGKISKIAKRAGRARGIATQARRARVTEGNVPTEIAYTRDLVRVLPTEIARLHPSLPQSVRAIAWGEWAGRGLLGWQLKGDAKERGAFVACVDVSPSMTSERADGETREVAAKGVAIGMAQVARQERRRYSLVSFADANSTPDPTNPKRHTLQALDGDQWQKQLEWAGTTFGGGTDFDTAVLATIELLQGLGEASKNADAVFISDGEGRVSNKVAAIWRAFREDTGARLIYIPVGDCSYGSIEALSDLVMPVDELDNSGADELAAQLAQVI